MNSSWPKLAAGLVLVVLAGSAFAVSDDPADELASFKVAPGFEVNLFASEADGVVNPIQGRFDPEGRLYVACSWVYPQLKPGQKPNDKVLVLEDTNGDGRADKTTVFADGLFIPTGLELGDGGIYVGTGTELLHFKDLDGDGRADERRAVLRGFGTGDSHQNINSFHWGPGGELYFSQGLHGFARVETPWGVAKLDQAGLWRLRPRLLKLESFFGGGMAPHNPWGFVHDDWGQMIVVAGNGHGIYDPLPVMIPRRQTRDIPQIWVNYRGRKLCGVDIIGNDHFPDAWQGAMVAGGVLNHAVFAMKIQENGSTLRVEDLPPLIESTHESFRPVDVKAGPDGALYVADWYNPIIGHYQASFRHPDRDKTHGRIWRVTAKGRALTARPNLVGASTSQLLDRLKDRDRWTRYQTKRVLADRPTAQVTNALAAWIAGLDPRQPDYEHDLFEALGVYETHEVVEPHLLRRLLEARDYRARAYAAGVIGHWQDRLDGALELLARRVVDEHPRVRLAAVVSCAYFERPEAVEWPLKPPICRWTIPSPTPWPRPSTP
jgi:glucose/arabinose dehydrogenase